jgi:hypothetical protein
MIEARIIKNGQVANRNTRSTQTEAEAWVAQESANGSFGLNARPEIGEDGFETGETLPAEWSVEYVDVTEIVRKQKRIEKGVWSQDKGRQLLAIIYSINDEKLELGLLNAGQFQAILADTNFAFFERLLQQGSIGSAATLFAQLSSPFYNDADKAEITAALTAAIAEQAALFPR